MQRLLMTILLVPIFCLSLQSCQHQKKIQRASVNINNPLLNQQIGSLFLIRNKMKPGISILPSGLQYFIIRDGIGDYASLNDLVTVYYQGQYVGGKVFDSQHYQNSPVTVRVSSVIPSWQQALQLMRPGSIWVLYVPPHLAYGDRGIPGLIGPKQTVIYTVHLLSVKKS